MPDHARHHLPHRVVTAGSAGPVDVLVVGGGPAGSAAAVTAARAGCSVVLVERAGDDEAGTAPRIGEGAGPGTRSLVEEVFGPGTAAFDAAAHLVCPGVVSVWGADQPVATDHLRNPLGAGWTLDRRRFDAGLRRAAGALGVTVVPGTRVTSVEAAPGAWAVGVRGPGGPTELACRAVVDASGRGAGVARRLGAHRRTLDRLVALWLVGSATPGDVMASTVVESAPEGWWYSCLLPGGRRTVVHLTDSDLLDPGLRQAGPLLAAACRRPVIGPLVERWTTGSVVAGPRVSAAATTHLDRFGGPGWAAAGDAALAFDPLSGRGIVSALLTGQSAGAAAAEAAAGHGAAALDRHQAGTAANLRHGLEGRTAAYGDEGRWPGSPFWMRRRPPTIAV